MGRGGRQQWMGSFISSHRAAPDMVPFTHHGWRCFVRLVQLYNNCSRGRWVGVRYAPMPSTRRPAALNAVCGDPRAERFEARREGVELGEGAEVVLVPIGSKRGFKWVEVIGESLSQSLLRITNAKFK